jgi:creatinine amidohydrolase
LRKLDPKSLRDYLKDGNYGGRYQRDDEEMMKIWRVAVAETRELLDRW